jgi:hypothetical protein
MASLFHTLQKKKQVSVKCGIPLSMNFMSTAKPTNQPPFIQFMAEAESEPMSQTKALESMNLPILDAPHPQV